MSDNNMVSKKEKCPLAVFASTKCRSYKRERKDKKCRKEGKAVCNRVLEKGTTKLEK